MILDFDTDAVEPQKAFEALPAGQYLVEIDSVDVKDTKDGSGNYLKLGLRVLEGDAKGRMVFDQINLRNKNEKAKEIGRRVLAGLLECVGLVAERDMSRLVGRQAVARVVVENHEKYGAQNKVRGYKASDDFKPTATTTQPKARAWMKEGK
jgi:hypothetical protein